MTKAEQSKILEELIDQAQLAKFREDIVVMAQMMAVDFQIQLMQKLIAGLSPKHPTYPALKAQVDVAVAHFEKRVLR